MIKNLYGSYLSIVVQNDDPEKRGRVKVFVPHISVTLYDDWNKTKEDKTFIFPDKELNPDLSKIMKQLKDVLPWAECANPLFGGSAKGRYNAFNEYGTTSDSNYWKDGNFIEGNRPTQNYVGNNKYPDAFTETNKNRNRFVNPYAYEYTPSDYSNLSRGFFSIPNVGAHLWVFFAGGDPNFPVYFAESHGREDWRRIYSTSQKSEDEKIFVDYPASYENMTKEEDPAEKDKQIFRSKVVFNSNKHTIELVDTDNREILKMTHYSGSFKEFNNIANIEMATNNDQKMVIGNQFYTVQKNQSVYVGQSQEVIVIKDRYKNIGMDIYPIVKQIYDILKEIHEYKRLFEGQRAESGVAPNEVSIYQHRKGNFNVCPVCGGIGWEPQEWFIQPALYTGTPGNQNDMGALGTYSQFVGQVGYYLGSPCDTCNNLVIFSEEIANGTHSPGESPSTQDGNWTPEPLKQPNGKLDTLLKEKAVELANLEKLTGEGDEIIEIAKNKVETIGTVMNDLKSFRVDPIGKLRIDGVNVALEGVYPTYRRSPHVEYVDVSDIPGGDYNLTCTNKYKLLVGAKGINFKTFGPIDMYGTIVNMTGEQINVSSQNEVLIDGGERFSIRARKISLIPIEHQPVVVDGQMHVTRNAIVGGGLYVEGEVGFLHATTPYEFAQTELSPEPFTYLTDIPSTHNVPSHVHFLLPHIHVYKRSPTTFLPSREAVRDNMRTRGDAGINSNIGLASAGLIAGITGGGTVPEAIWVESDACAKCINSTVGYIAVRSTPINNVTTKIEVIYNIRWPATDAGEFVAAGLVLTYLYTLQSEPLDDIVQLQSAFYSDAAIAIGAPSGDQSSLCPCAQP